MTNSIVDAESVLAIDIGTVTTRAILFDVVDGLYAFIASGISPSTAQAPYDDPNTGVIQAVRQLQEVTGHALLGAESRLVLPSQSDGSGIDRLVITCSTGPELHLVVAGLLADVSLESAQRLAASTYGQVVETVGLNDRRRNEAQLDAVLNARPDIIIFAGATENGASRSMGRLVDLLGLACRVLPQDRRPEILYAGNTALGKPIQEFLQKWAPVHLAPNIRPTFDAENLAPAQAELSDMVMRIRMRQMPGLANLVPLASAPPLPTAFAFGRMLRLVSKLFDPTRCVMGLDVGAASTTLAAATGGSLNLLVAPFGAGQGAKAVLEQSKLKEIERWLPMQVSEDVVKEYLWQKINHPASLPVTPVDLAIEMALVRQAVQLAASQFAGRFPAQSPYFERVLASGAALAQAPSPAHTLLMLLDGLQPTGITTFVLDQNGLTAVLGAAAATSALLAAQVLESGAYVNLGTVICPVSTARYGTPVLDIKLDYGDGNVNQSQVLQGSLVALPLKAGQSATIHLHALHGTQIDPRLRRSTTSFKLVGGACGAVIDTRGRPLQLPLEDARRQDQLRKWSMALGI